MTAIVRPVILGLFAATCCHSSAAADEEGGLLGGLKDKAKSAGVKKAKEMLAELREYSAEVKKAGYEMGSVAVEVDLTPAVEVDFVRKKKLSAEEMEALIEENKGKKSLAVVLKALSAANELDVLGYRVEKVTVRLPLLKTIIALSPTE